MNILNENDDDLIGECRRYKAEIEARVGIELFLGGIGEDGYIALNELGAPILLYLSPHGRLPP